MSMNEVRILNRSSSSWKSHEKTFQRTEVFFVNRSFAVNKFKMFAFHLIRSEQCSGYTCVKNSDFEIGQSNGVNFQRFM